MTTREPSEIRVAIVSDQRVFGESLALALDGDAKIAIDAVVSRSDSAGLRSRRTLVVLVDLEGLDAALERAVQSIRERAPRAGIIVLSSHNDAPTLHESIEAGAEGNVSKDQGLAELRHAIHCVASGVAYLDSKRSVPAEGERPNISPPNINLSPREQDVLRLLSEGHGNREIAARLNVAHKTVKNHVSNILAKLATTSRTQAVVHAIRDGII